MGDGTVKFDSRKVKGLRNKRNKNSPKAIMAKLAKKPPKDDRPRNSDGSGSKDKQWDY